MKTSKLIALVSILALMIGGCGINKMVKNYPQVDIQLENRDLENRGGKVDYTIKGSIPPKYLKKKAVMEIEVPYMVYENANGETVTKSMDKITLVGEKAKVPGTVISYKNGGNFSKNGSFEFQEDYLNAQVSAVSTISMGKQSQQMAPRNLGEGIYNTSSFISLFPEFAESDYDGKITGNGSYFVNAPHQYRPEFLTETAVIYFEVNMSNLNWNLKLNRDEAAKERIKKFVDFLNEGRVIDKVVIYGWASPEGEESRNQGLSEKRFEQGKKWFTEQYNKYWNDYAKKNNIKPKDLQKPELVFENHANGEDWSGFEAAVERSNIAEKNQILNIVRSQPNSAQREQKIREMTDIYNEIKEMILPPLRRAEITLVCNKNKYNDDQIRELVISSPQELSLSERLYAATLTKDIKEKERIYTALVEDEIAQKDWRAFNNLAVVNIDGYLNTRDVALLNTAKSNLNKANAISPSNGIILNNMALVEFLSGNVNEAKTRFEESHRASTHPINQNYNLGAYEILKGDYANAQKMMNNKHCDFNMALSQLVNKEYAAAKTTLDCIPNKDAKVYYLQAVLAARTNNQAEVFSALKTSIDMDRSFAQKAQKDPEFKKYRNDNEFKNIVR